VGTLETATCGKISASLLDKRFGASHVFGRTKPISFPSLGLTHRVTPKPKDAGRNKAGGWGWFVPGKVDLPDLLWD
jgi:hypothetical protein